MNNAHFIVLGKATLRKLRSIMQKYSKRDLESWATIPHSHFVRSGGVNDWATWMANVDFVADWSEADSLVGQVLLANTWPELLAPRLLERLGKSVSLLEADFGRDLNFRIGLVAIGDRSGGVPPVHTCCLFDHDGVTYLGPRLHSQDKRVMLSTSLTASEKATIVGIDLAAVFKGRDAEGNDMAIAGIAMAMPDLGPESPTNQLFLNPGVPDVVTDKRPSHLSPGTAFYLLTKAGPEHGFTEQAFEICERIETFLGDIQKEALLMNSDLREARESFRDQAMEQRVATQFELRGLTVG